MIQLIELVEAPPLLTQLATLETASLRSGVVNTIVFGAYMDHMDSCVGSFSPNMKRIHIDLGNALNDSAMYTAGMLFIPNTWFTAMWALYHEIEHARQLHAEPALIEFETLPQEYEDMAMQAGEDALLSWSRYNSIPPLDQLGWLGKQLVLMLNNMYTRHPDVADEVNNLELGAAAELEAVFASWEFTPKGRQVLIEEIDAGNIGLKIGNDRFLTAYEFLGL